MSFFKRLFSADYRAAITAEAAGDFELAAERYALAGQFESAVRVHLARAQRARTSADEITALRDAIHWAPESSALHSQVCGRLGKALLTQSQSEGVATARDKARVAEAANLLMDAENWREAGDAWELIGEHTKAIEAFSRGGELDRLENALARESEQSSRARRERESFADYELLLRTGDRDGARNRLRDSLEAAQAKSEYRRLADKLDSRMITGGKVELAPRRGPTVTVCGNDTIIVGRDPLCDLTLRTGGVSRRHAEITVSDASSRPRFHLRDLGSRNGTFVGEIPISGAIALVDSGEFRLGENHIVRYQLISDGCVLHLEVQGGLDGGFSLYAAGQDEVIALTTSNIPATVTFRGGRPLLHVNEGSALTLNGELLAQRSCQLIREDELIVDDTEFTVR